MRQLIGILRLLSPHRRVLVKRLSQNMPSKSVLRKPPGIYTAPIKALSNQKYRDFYAEYGDKIGIVTGDVVLNPYAQVLLMTTEIFRNTIFDDIERLQDVSYVIFDEIHYINDIERGLSGKRASSSPPNISNSSA